MGKSDALSCCSDHGSGLDDNGDLIFFHPELFTVRTLEGLTLVREERGIIQDVKRALEKGIVEDEMAGAVRKL